MNQPGARRELSELKRYVHETLGISMKPRSWSGTERLPHFLRERYDFAQAELPGVRALLVIDTGPEDQSPATVRKHMDMLQSRQPTNPATPVYVRAQVTAYNRKRLIEQKVPFIVPGNQIHQY